jgi:dihydrofolate reductase
LAKRPNGISGSQKKRAPADAKRYAKGRAMAEIVYHVAASLDGNIATADGGVDWLSRFRTTGEDHGIGDPQASVDALLLGSHTYEFALKLEYWPSPEKPSWVFTQRDLQVLHPSITLTSQRPREIVELLEARGLRRAWLMGGGKLAASFHGERLISRYIIIVFPILLASGVSLFAPHSSQPDPRRLVAAKPFKSGIVQLTYDCAQNAEQADSSRPQKTRRLRRSVQRLGRMRST